MPRAVTLADIAEKVGVSKATVSRVLNNKPKVKEEVRQRVRETAEAMGYRPNPALRALVHHRWDNPDDKHARYGMALVKVQAPQRTSKNLPGMLKSFHQQSVEEDVRKQAEALGYDFEEHDSSDYESPQQLASMLAARGIDGILFYQKGQEFEWDFPCESFSCVALNFEAGLNHCHSIVSDWSSAISVAVDALCEQGCKRIGMARFVHEKPSLDRTLQAFFNYESERLSQTIGPQPGHYTYDTDTLLNIGPRGRVVKFAEWLEREQPEAIIDGSFQVFWWLKDLGIRLGKDIHLANLKKQDSEPLSFIPAADHLFERQGRRAVNILGDLMRNNVKGLSDHPTLTSHKCQWHPGYFESPEGLDALLELY